MHWIVVPEVPVFEFPKAACGAQGNEVQSERTGRAGASVPMLAFRCSDVPVFRCCACGGRCSDVPIGFLIWLFRWCRSTAHAVFRLFRCPPSGFGHTKNVGHPRHKYCEMLMRCFDCNCAADGRCSYLNIIAAIIATATPICRSSVARNDRTLPV